MIEYYGYCGRILRINLSSGDIKVEDLKNGIIKEFLGGVGFATKIITSEVDPKVDPLSPNNKLVFAVGPLTGTSVFMTGRHIISAKSPLTGFWGQSDAGGFWGAELKFAGYDAIIVEGASEKPVYISIFDDKIELNDASEIWGLDTYETEIYLKKIHGEKSKVLTIGQAGENLVR
ncbi:MAG: aldehyde ferredoxin oxidoreductase N-terminal domain-containing protein, partial [Candidatus Asgardarchaeia archaeon]